MGSLSSNAEAVSSAAEGKETICAGTQAELLVLSREMQQEHPEVDAPERYRG